MRRLKIIIVSNSPWRSDNAFGNSFTNLFKGMENIEIANIFCKYGFPETDVASRFFQITEKTIIDSILHGTESGHEVELNQQQEHIARDGEKIFNKMKRYKSLFMGWVRGAIWKTGRWKSQALDNFLDQFQPDLVFICLYYSYYIHDINHYIMKRCNIPAVCYVPDDVCSLRQFSLSPFFWIDRLAMHSKLKHILSECDSLYAISDLQCLEYGKMCGREFKLLTKSADFEGEPAKKEAYQKPLQLVYTGNIGTNRWKSLAMLARALQKINRTGIQMQLHIYTATPLTAKMKMALNIQDTSFLEGTVPADRVKAIQEEADMLVHVEPMDIKHKLMVRLSFSTKLVDYMQAGRPILAVGPHDIASIAHLIENQCALTGECEDELYEKLEEILKDPQSLNRFVERAWECGRNCHHKPSMQKMLYEDLYGVIEGASR